MMYWLTPVATNIIAAYPESIAFPVVAICNSNQHRITWITGDNIQKRQGKKAALDSNNFIENLNYSDIFDKALLQSWDMDAGHFLQNAAHQRSRMIVRCELPNGSRCNARDFRPVWTLTGLCWAINVDSANPIHVNGAGPGNALRLLVNIERYERIESCTPKLRSRFLPGLKVLIYNQTDVPPHYLEGVNIPAGFTMDIPFWMRHRQKLPGRDCIVTKISDNEKKNENGSQNKNSERDCLMRSYLKEIERRCNCSMREAYFQEIVNHKNKHKDDLPKQFSQCNVLQYFECVQSVLEWARNMGFNNFKHCPIPCESVDYTAWQDMNELPSNIFPKLISDWNVDEDEEDNENEEESVETTTNNNKNLYQNKEQSNVQTIADSVERDKERAHYQCTHNKLLSTSHVRRIKNEAQLAYEKQAQYQEDIQLRTKHLIEQFRKSISRIVEMQWGWKNDYFLGANKRLKQMVGCYAEIPLIHSDVFSAIFNLKPQGEEERANQMIQLLNESFIKNNLSKHYQTIGEVKREFGIKADGKYKEIEMMEELLKNIKRLFSEETFTEHLPNRIERIMSKILNFMRQFEEGSLRRKEWAERMNARNMRHFFDEDFYENWYNLIVKDLENGIIGTIQKIEQLIPQLYSNTVNGTAIMVRDY
uniref:Uncharacterized protein n=1 Tax=Meloidogyne floridensis TaxID=298350 RepID=A0A915PBC6_9BILA